MAQAKDRVDSKGSKKNAVKEMASQLAGLRLLGDVVTFNTRSKDTILHKHVVEALTIADLDTNVARELLPRHAFSRASRQLTEDRVIDVTKETPDEMYFQFTKKVLDIKAEEWSFIKETSLLLNKTTGVIKCANKELESKAQQLLDAAIEERTTSDITKIVQKLFDKHAALFPLRDQGGVYFVPIEHTEFIIKIETFLAKLGGRITRFPVPAGTQYGDKSVQNSIADAMQQLVDDHEAAVKQFTINTRKDTIEHAAEKIKATRVKVEAYANYLTDRKDELLASVDAANVLLLKQVESLSGIRESMPAATEGSKLLFGHSVTAVIRWMGKSGWDFSKSKKALVDRGLSIADATVRAQLLAGRKGDRGDPASLSEEQAIELEQGKEDLEARRQAIKANGKKKGGKKDKPVEETESVAS